MLTTSSVARTAQLAVGPARSTLPRSGCAGLVAGGAAPAGAEKPDPSPAWAGPAVTGSQPSTGQARRGTPAPRKAKLLNAVRIVWGFRDLLPGQCRLPEAAPWDGASGHNLAKVIVRGGGSKTPRIAAATMEALLAWSLRMLEDLGPDIAGAWEEYRQLNDGTHPSQRRFDGLTPAGRLARFLADARRDGAALPGQRGADGRWQVSPSHLRRLLGLGSDLQAGQARR